MRSFFAAQRFDQGGQELAEGQHHQYEAGVELAQGVIATILLSLLLQQVLESQLAEEWGRKQGAVISCGGGVVLREANLRALEANGLLVCLTARPDVILARTARSQKRPLLAGEDPEKKIRDLLAARAPYYAAIPVQIDTSDLGPEELAAQLLARWKQPG